MSGPRGLLGPYFAPRPLFLHTLPRHVFKNSVFAREVCVTMASVTPRKSKKEPKTRQVQTQRMNRLNIASKQGFVTHTSRTKTLLLEKVSEGCEKAAFAQ